MEVNFRWKRQRGSFTYSENKVVVQCDDLVIKEEIERYFRQPITRLKDFSHPGIPGAMETTTPIKTVEQFTLGLEGVEKEVGIWLEAAGCSIVDVPWFGTLGYTLLRWNESVNNPWWVIEDIATGAQAFFQRDAYLNAKLEWFFTSITKSKLTEHWIDCTDSSLRCDAHTLNEMLQLTDCLE